MSATQMPPHKTTTGQQPELTLGNVMLIDDEQIDQMMYNRVISRSGMAQNIISFSYAEKALAYLQDVTNPVTDLIFLDINMPRMNGFEFLEAATASLGPAFSSSVVIMLTTSLNPQDQARAQTFERVKAYINKPLTQADLVQAAQLLAQNRAAELKTRTN